MTYTNTLIDFYNPFGHDVLKGIVKKDNGVMLQVEVQHGEHHGKIWEIPYDDVIEDNSVYGYSDETFEEMYSWDNGDE